MSEAGEEFLYRKELERTIDEEIKKRVAGEQLLAEQTRYALLGEMIGATAHQMKQPLSAIRMLASDIEFLLLDDKVSSDEITSDVKMIQAQIDHMSSTINSFRNFLTPYATARYFVLTESINGVFMLLSGMLKEAGIDINVEIARTNGNIICNCTQLNTIDCEPIYIQGSDVEFKQVLINLLANTRDAIKELNKTSKIAEGTVIIQISVSENEMVTIKYRDNAGGMPENILKSMFQPYNTSKGEFGTGVGMYISGKIIEKMSGTITAANVGLGSMFTISIPLYKEEVVRL
jgi:signal transduction histidine kinase